MRQRASARSCAWAGTRPFDYALFAGGQAHVFFALARIATSVRDSRATVHGGSGRFQAVGRGGRDARLSLLDPASLLAIQVVSGGGGIRTPEGT
jgi:hypothetical protein